MGSDNGGGDPRDSLPEQDRSDPPDVVEQEDTEAQEAPPAHHSRRATMTRYSAKIRFEKDGELMGPHAEAEVYVDVGPEGTETAALAALYAALEQVGYHMRRTLEVEDGD